MKPGRRVRVTSGDAAVVARAVATLAPRAGEMVAVLVAARGAPDLPALVEELAAADLCFFGGLFPHIVDGEQTHDSGVLAFTLPRLGEPMLCRHLDSDGFEVPDCVSAVRGRAEGSKPTALVLVDGLTANVSRFLETVFHQLGGSVSYWGGGAGVNARTRSACVFTRRGVFQDAAVIALAGGTSRVGVGHGWKEIRGPFVATRSKRNVIAQLNWENAFEVYRGVVERDTPVKITPENFYSIASAYPFALRKQDQEVVVRCAVGLGEGGTLVCVGEVPENAVLSILKGEPALLIEAAGRAAREACPDDASLSLVTHCLVADCYSRRTILGSRFAEEIAAVNEGLGAFGRACSPLGMLTLGEIASPGEGYLDYFNKTCVVASMQGDR
jgi:hypothetical protein